MFAGAKVLNYYEFDVYFLNYFGVGFGFGFHAVRLFWANAKANANANSQSFITFAPRKPNAYVQKKT